MRGFVLDGVPTSIEVEYPREHFVPCGAHEPSIFQHQAHLLPRVDKGPKPLAYSRNQKFSSANKVRTYQRSHG
jgi:hypothetical protein